MSRMCSLGCFLSVGGRGAGRPWSFGCARRIARNAPAHVLGESGLAGHDVVAALAERHSCSGTAQDDERVGLLVPPCTRRYREEMRFLRTLYVNAFLAGGSFKSLSVHGFEALLRS